MKLVLCFFLVIQFDYFHSCKGLSYEEGVSLHSSLLDKSVYNTQLRPLRNLSDLINVHVKFNLVSLVDVDDVSQSFKCNGFVFLKWRDELLVRDGTANESLKFTYPRVEDVWKPRLNLINTMGDRDPFKDDISALRVKFDGSAEWYPGGLFHASCRLDMTRFPFDQQACSLIFFAMVHDAHELRFLSISDGDDGAQYETFNTEWNLLSSQTLTSWMEVQGEAAAIVTFTFTMRRRPYTFLYTFLLPALLLSVLSFFVFLIPVDSGEKISYGVTVLLAQAVFMTTLSSLLPASTGPPPPATVYLLVLLNIEACTVIASIVVVYLHRLDKGDVQTYDRHQFSEWPESPNCASEDKCFSTSRPEEDDQKVKIYSGHRWKVVSKWTNVCCFVLAFLVWISMTVWFFSTVLS